MKRKRFGMQHQPVSGLQRLAFCIEAIPHDHMPQAEHMDAQLMGAPRMRKQAHQRADSITVNHLPVCNSLLAAFKTTP